MGRFEIAKGLIPEPEKEKKTEPEKKSIKKSNKRVVINYEDGENVRQVVVNYDNNSEVRPIRQRSDAHPGTHVGGGNSSGSREDNASESFDLLLDQLLDRKM